MDNYTTPENDGVFGGLYGYFQRGNTQGRATQQRPASRQTSQRPSQQTAGARVADSCDPEDYSFLDSSQQPSRQTSHRTSHTGAGAGTGARVTDLEDYRNPYEMFDTPYQYQSQSRHTTGRQHSARHAQSSYSMPSSYNMPSSYSHYTSTASNIPDIVTRNRCIIYENTLPKLNVHAPTVFKVDELLVRVPTAGTKQGSIMIFDGSANQATHHFHKQNSKCAILNFANSHCVGGGYSGGTASQEASLCQTIIDLYPSLSSQPSAYPFKWNETILYSKDLSMYRYDSYQNRSNALFTTTDPIKVSVITASAPCLTSSDLLTCHKNPAKLYDAIKNLIYGCCLTPVCADDDVDTLILGAFGCGVFAPAPSLWATFSTTERYSEMMARLFVEVLQEHPELLTRYTTICFAIPDDGKSDSNGAFKQVFASKTTFTQERAELILPATTTVSASTSASVPAPVPAPVQDTPSSYMPRYRTNFATHEFHDITD